MYKIKYNLILKSFIIFLITYSLLKIVPFDDITNKDLFLIILVILISYYFINLI